MADLPATQNESAVPASRAQKLKRWLLQGYTVRQISAKASGGDKRKARVIRSQCYRLLATDKELQTMIGLQAKGILIEGLGPTSEAVARRARRGRTDAAKLQYEATGFHNPRVQHDHSGDVKITVELPRPELGTGKDSQADSTADEIPDAEVVED